MAFDDERLKGDHALMDVLRQAMGELGERGDDDSKAPDGKGRKAPSRGGSKAP